MGQRVLVTGGADFIGSHTVDLLLQQGYEVRILDSLQPRVHPLGKPDYLPANMTARGGPFPMPKTINVEDIPGLKRLLAQLDDEDVLVLQDAGRPVAAVVPYDAEERSLTQAMMRLSEPAFAAVWSAPEDEVYDDL